jgi:hypothetical protein
VIPGAQSHVERHRRAFAAYFREQIDRLTPYDVDEWNDLLAGIVSAQAFRTVEAFALEVTLRFGTTFDASRVENWIAEYARISAEATNQTTLDELAAAAASDEPELATEGVWSKAIRVRAVAMAVSKVTTEGNFGREEAGRQSGVRTKRWVVTSVRPRSSHAAMNGETVDMGDTFSNGAKWPGDPSLSIEERAGCSCLLDF